MHARIRYLTMLFAICRRLRSRRCRTHRGGRTPVHEHRPEYDAVSDERQHADRHVAAPEQLLPVLGLPDHRLRRLRLRLVTPGLATARLFRLP